MNLTNETNKRDHESEEEEGDEEEEEKVEEQEGHSVRGSPLSWVVRRLAYLARTGDLDPAIGAARVGSAYGLCIAICLCATVKTFFFYCHGY